MKVEWIGQIVNHQNGLRFLMSEGNQELKKELKPISFSKEIRADFTINL